MASNAEFAPSESTHLHEEFVGWYPDLTSMTLRELRTCDSPVLQDYIKHVGRQVMDTYNREEAEKARRPHGQRGGECENS
jgi:hypothetical protein